MQMTEVVNRRKIRHAHMVNINRQIMLEGMRADFAEGRSHQPESCGDGAQGFADSSEDIRLERIWSPISIPLISGSRLPASSARDKWGNLPGGEVFTTPGEVNGTFVIDGVVGDYLCAKFGDLKQNPLTIRIEKNRLVSAESRNQELRDDFWAYTHTDENSDRVGEFAIGTNIELKDVIGEILQDEKYPGRPHCVW